MEATVVAKLTEGIKVGNREYRFLGGSNSLLAEHGCYLLAPYYNSDNSLVNAHSIRKSVGHLELIRNAATYLSRLGLAFSQTEKGIRIDKSWVTFEEDIVGERGRYTFSDGIGKISTELAEMVSMSALDYVQQLSI